MIGVWTATRVNFAANLPFPVLLLVTGAITCAVGVLDRAARAPAVGALPGAHHADGRRGGQRRARGDQLPERRRRVHRAEPATPDLSGLQPVRQAGHRRRRHRLLPLRRGRRRGDVPASRSSTSAGKPGRAWAAIRESEPAALAAGVNITLYKLWAFALASFMTGVAGVLARGAGRPAHARVSSRRRTRSRCSATTLIGGIYSLWGAVVAGVLQPAAAVPLPGAVGHRPELRARSSSASGLLQVLLTAPGGLAQQFPKDMANLGRLLWRGVGKVDGATTETRHDRGRGAHRPLRRRDADRRR